MIAWPVSIALLRFLLFFVSCKTREAASLKLVFFVFLLAFSTTGALFADFDFEFLPFFAAAAVAEQLRISASQESPSASPLVSSSTNAVVSALRNIFDSSPPAPPAATSSSIPSSPHSSSRLSTSWSSASFSSSSGSSAGASPSSCAKVSWPTSSSSLLLLLVVLVSCAVFFFFFLFRPPFRFCSPLRTIDGVVEEAGRAFAPEFCAAGDDRIVEVVVLVVLPCSSRSFPTAPAGTSSRGVCRSTSAGGRELLDAALVPVSGCARPPTAGPIVSPTPSPSSSSHASTSRADPNSTDRARRSTSPWRPRS
mmetsp:Transcript_12971/g.31637  ORF Transcript_12971/g.31637 Transcript_12971/m.31637 type:complete len:309 (+) Transcript_12971:1255-2181(+)